MKKHIKHQPGMAEVFRNLRKLVLIEMYRPSCNAPFVANALVKIAMKLEDNIPIPLNGTLLIVGSVMQVDIDASMVGSDGFVALSEAEVLISQGLDAYFVSKAIGRLPYAKPLI